MYVCIQARRICSFVPSYPHVRLYSSRVVVKEALRSQQREVAVVLLLLSSSSGYLLLVDSQTHTCPEPHLTLPAVELHLSGRTDDAACKLCL